jgi:UDP-glucose 4-epimerase
MRVCVTGAAGFIGEYVCRALVQDHHDVTVLDVREPMWTTQWVDADIMKPLPVGKYDAVVHLAAMANPRECEQFPENALAINVGGTWNALNMAMASGAKKFVFASSAHVYGISPKYLPTDEEHPLWMQNTYTMSKILGESLCSLYYANHGLAYTTLRLYNAYGPEQSRGYFIPDMLHKANHLGNISLPGGNTTKDFVHVTDVADAFRRAVETSFVGPINIGTGVETRLSTIASQIADHYNAAVETTPSLSATRMQANRGRAYRVLGWEPTVKVEDGINACLRENEGAPVPAKSSP